MKKLMKLCLCLCMLTILFACSKGEEPFNKKEEIIIEDTLSIKFKAMQFTKKVTPVNTNVEYVYRYSKDDNETLMDVQFYVENKTDKEIHVEDYLSAKMVTEEDELIAELCVESNNYTEVYNKDNLDAHQKSIAHLIFYISDEDAKKYQDDKKDKPDITISLKEDTYSLPIKKEYAKEKKLEKDRVQDFNDFTIKVISASTSPVIPPINYNENSNWYEVDSEDKQYAGMYAEITNKTDKPLNLMTTVAASLSIKDKEPFPSWITILSEDNSNFIDEATDIPANSTRTVLFFMEVDLDYEDTEYTFHLSVDGIPYKYSYIHTVIAR